MHALLVILVAVSSFFSTVYLNYLNVTTYLTVSGAPFFCGVLLVGFFSGWRWFGWVEVIER